MRQRWIHHRVYFVPVLIIAIAVAAWPWLSRITAQVPSAGTVSESFAAAEAADLVASKAGQASAARAANFSTWMANHNWKELSLPEQRRLYDHLDTDKIRFPQMSIRWTGTLTAGITSNYQFVQMRQLVHDSVLKVWLDDQLILDSTPAEGAREATEAQFVSAPVHLAAGQAVALRAEVSCAATAEQLSYSVGAPLAVLAWQTPAQGRQLIPTDSLAPPADAGFTPEARGLKAEYFSGTDFTLANRQATRLDPGVEMSWSWGPVVPVYDAELQSLRHEFWSQFTDAAALAAGTDLQLASLLDQAVWQMSHRYSLTQRRALVLTLQENPRLLQAMSTYAMGKLMESIYMLPGREHLDLLRQWSLVRPQPRTEIGTIPGWGPGTYETANLEFYWLIGHFLRGPYWSDVLHIWETSLQRPDGECNLTIAYATAFTAEAQQDRSSLLERLRAGVNDEQLSGDQRLTWQLALAFAEGAFVYGEPQPIRGLEHVQRALESANSSGYQFWALQEIVARLASLDESVEANRLLDEYQAKFQAVEQQAAMAEWRKQAATLAREYQERRGAPLPTNRERVVSFLTSRREEAQSRGDTAAVSRFDELLRAAGAVTAPSL